MLGFEKLKKVRIFIDMRLYGTIWLYGLWVYVVYITGLGLGLGLGSGLWCRLKNRIRRRLSVKCFDKAQCSVFE